MDYDQRIYTLVKICDAVINNEDHENDELENSRDDGRDPADMVIPTINILILYLLRYDVLKGMTVIFLIRLITSNKVIRIFLPLTVLTIFLTDADQSMSEDLLL
ncbi:hypothetical protein [Texcoconibacillus texcoconensis]|uniref:Uncharacterized protein n=1 Tax=Texcoconibacillus texcoconensis TaxID=1095777 RepID=A0A840QQG7_9BACI|nr:hypothetical protein [Texcoconibacillus texcoconensis]MBB5173676.1 hypothetical protein [Texcoconibacillus texcoconensis]